MYEIPSWMRVLLIKDEIEEYINAHPEVPVFEFFICCREDIPICQAAAAHVSLATGKQISLIFPTSVTIKPQEEKTMREEAPVPVEVKEL